MSTASLEGVKALVDRLSDLERAELVDYLLRSLAQNPNSDPGFDRELSQRLERMRTGADPGIDAEEMFDELRRRIS